MIWKDRPDIYDQDALREIAATHPNAKWVVERYGTIRIRRSLNVCVAVVLIWEGVAIGIGETSTAAISDLREQLNSDIPDDEERDEV